MNQLSKNYNGLYRRYCDDLIVVIPIAKGMDRALLIRDW